MTRNEAIPYVSYAVDDALAERQISEIPDHAKLVGWQCGFEPLFVAVWSYLGIPLSNQDAEEIAIDLLLEKDWFADPDNTAPDYIL